MKSVFAGNILEELNEAGATTLAEYFERANMSDILTSDGPFTLFAPTNEAFDELTPSLRDSLDNNDDFLDAILSYHIVQVSVLSTYYCQDKRNLICKYSVEQMSCVNDAKQELASPENYEINKSYCTD